MSLGKSGIKFQTISKRIASFTAALVFSAGILAANVPVAKAASLSAAPRVTFTFDDGLDSTSTYAAPILKAAGFTATDFVISGCVGMTTVPNTCHANENAKYMTWAQINALKTNGWEIGSHTVTHPCLASSAALDADDCPATALTTTQVNSELTTSKLTIGTQTGVTPTDFATPYGDWTPPVLSQIAQVYASHRGFADSIDQGTTADGIIDHGNTFPYNDYLLYDLPVTSAMTVAQIESYITQTVTSKQWLVISFHDVLPTASTNPDDYQYSSANFQQIVNFVKTSGIQVVNINGGLAGGTNLLPNSSFDTALSTATTNTTVWSTDAPANIKQDTGSHGSYPSPANSVLLTGSAANIHLFSPQVAVASTKSYVFKNYLNVVSMNVAAGHEIAFYIDEYNAAGAYLQTQYKKSEVGNAGNASGAWVENLNFEYKPTSATVTKARLQVVVTANSGAQAYLDNVQWFAEDGTAAVVAAGKAGDVNGDNLVNALDLSIMLSHWNKAGTRAQGDLSGDGKVNALDFSILLSNWNK